MTALETNLANLEKLKAALAGSKFPDKDRDFATSLVEQAARRGLTPRQWYWVGRLTAQAGSVARTRVVGDFSGVYALFQRAKSKLRNPKVRLQTEESLPLQLYLAGERSKVPNVVNVTNGIPYGVEDSKWYGRVAPDGKWTPNTRIPEAELAPVAKLLKRLARDPEGVASEYGRLTGLCCFCYRPLADERSTAVGYGPQCAERYGLSWGTKVRAGANPPREETPAEEAVGRRVRVRRAVAV